MRSGFLSPSLPAARLAINGDIGEERNVAASHPDIVAKFDDYIRTARTDSPDWPIEKQAPRSNKDKNIPAAV
jgi:hypothetical protein